MKKAVLAIAVSLVMINCGGGKKTETTENNVTVQSNEVVDQALKDEHNAKNSLDYAGTYRGILPTASGEGMEVTLILTDSVYSKSVTYVGKMGVAMVEQGAYSWNDAGTTITLEKTTAPNQYFVAENMLIQLDIEGNRIEGELADQYQLKKDLDN